METAAVPGNEILTGWKWEQYEREGYVILGQMLSGEEVATLQQRLTDIMMGTAPVDYSRMVMQRDREEGEREEAGPQSLGFKGPSPHYRVIYGLEHDALFLKHIRNPVFREVCRRVYGPATEIAAYRAFVMNKPAHGGSRLNWHQDRWTFLTPDPLLTVWTALDPATVANGCLKVIPGSHRSLINPGHEAGFLRPEQLEEYCGEDKVVHVELKPGEVALLHNWLLHSSDINTTDIPRRGFSVCYIDAATKDSRPAEVREQFDQAAYPVIFGQNEIAA